jgi:hypothetical protein
MKWFFIRANNEKLDAGISRETARFVLIEAPASCHRSNSNSCTGRALGAFGMGLRCRRIPLLEISRGERTTASARVIAKTRIPACDPLARLPIDYGLGIV